MGTGMKSAYKRSDVDSPYYTEGELFEAGWHIAEMLRKYAGIKVVVCQPWFGTIRINTEFSNNFLFAIWQRLVYRYSYWKARKLYPKLWPMILYGADNNWLLIGL